MEFDQIFEAYFGDVFRYVRGLSGDEYIAEEITSETFFKALRSIDSYRGECDIRVWLCQIAKNTYYSYIRKAGKIKTVEIDTAGSIADPSACVAERVADAEQARQVREVLHTLNEPYREVFMWRVFAELSFTQIGQIFGKTENWACVTYHRARKMLRSRLEENRNEK